jgi:uncharacterized protein YjbJ (UPF0337 family)
MAAAYPIGTAFVDTLHYRGHERVRGISRKPQRSNAMNWDTMKGQWRELKGKVRERWGQFTDDDLERIEGKRDQLLGRLQQRYGYTKEEAEHEIKDFERAFD